MKAETRDLIAQLNRIRLDGNLSYAEMATAINLDPGGLYKILNGKSEPYDRTLHKIRRYLETLPAVPAAPRKQPRKARGRAA